MLRFKRPFPDRSAGLIYWELESVQVIMIGVDASLVVLARWCQAIAVVHRQQWPSTDRRRLALVFSSEELGWESLWLNTLLDPIDDRAQLGLRPRSVRFVRVGRAMSSAWHQEQLIPLLQGSRRFIVAHVRVHDLSNALEVSDGARGRD